MTRQEELHKIKKISLLSFLSDFGISEIKSEGNRHWFKALNRDEDTASVCVYTKDFYDDWFDYGASEGGSIIDFCMKQMSMKYIDAIRILRKYIE